MVWSESSGSGRRALAESCVHGNEHVLSVRGRDLFLAPWATVYSSGTPLHHVKYECLCSCCQYYSYINRSLIVLYFFNPVSYGMKLTSFIAFLKLYILEYGTLFSSSCQTWKTDEKHLISLPVTCITEDSVSSPTQLLPKYIANEFLHNVWPLLHFLLTEVANKAFIILNGHYLSWFWWVIAEQLQQAWNYYAVFLFSPSSAYYVHGEGRKIVPQCP